MDEYSLKKIENEVIRITALMVERGILIDAGTGDPEEVIMNPNFVDSVFYAYRVVSKMDNEGLDDLLRGTFVLAIINHFGSIGIDEEEINSLVTGCLAWFHICREKQIEEWAIRNAFYIDDNRGSENERHGNEKPN